MIRIALIAVLVSLFLMGFYMLSPNDGKKNDISQEVEVQTAERLTQVEIPSHITWEQLGITPQKSLEGDMYTFSAYDILDGATLAYIGNFAKEHGSLRLFSFEEKKIISDVPIKGILLDIFTQGNKIFILTDKDIVIVENNSISKRIPHGKPDIFLFDKVIESNGQLSVLMANGKSFSFSESGIQKHDRLKHGSDGVWIQKTSPRSFEMKNTNKSSLAYQSEKDMGAITFIGFHNDYGICSIEEIASMNPITIERKIASSKDNFEKTIAILKSPKFSIIKNDIKQHGPHIYHVTANENNLSIQTINLDL